MLHKYKAGVDRNWSKQEDGWMDGRTPVAFVLCVFTVGGSADGDPDGKEASG